MLLELVIASAIVISTPLAAMVLVSIASRREDRAQTLTRRPAGIFEASARRIVDFRSDQPDWRVPRTPAPSRPATGRTDHVCSARPADSSPVGSGRR